MKKDHFDSFDPNILRTFEIIKKISQGVWKVKNKKTNSIHALKKINSAFESSQEAKKTYRQISYLQMLQHPNIIKFAKIHKPLSTKDIYLQFEFMEADLCLALKNSLLKQIHKQYIFYQIINALVYLHTAQLIHRDIKPANVLINQACEVKISDFSMIRSLQKDKEQQIILTQNVSTRWYRAPEILLTHKNYGKPADIWSAGCILAEMILRKPIFQGGSSINQLQKIFEITGKPKKQDLYFIKNISSLNIIESIQISERKTIKEVLNIQDSYFCQLIESIFQVNPQKRPTALEILNHPSMIKFKGKVQCKISQKCFKIPYQSQLLSIEDYMSFVYEEKVQGNTQISKKLNIYKTLPNNLFGKTYGSPMSGQTMNKSPMRNSNMKNLNDRKYSPISFTSNPISPQKQKLIQMKRQRLSPPSFLLKRKENSSLSKIEQKTAFKMSKVQKKNSLPYQTEQIQQINQQDQNVNDQIQLIRTNTSPVNVDFINNWTFSPKAENLHRLIIKRNEQKEQKSQPKNIKQKYQSDQLIKKYSPFTFKNKQQVKTSPFKIPTKISSQKYKFNAVVKKSPLHINRISPKGDKINIQIINNNNITIKSRNSPPSRNVTPTRSFYPNNVK